MKISICWFIVVLSFNSLNMVSFSSLNVFTITTLKSISFNLGTFRVNFYWLLFFPAYESLFFVSVYIIYLLKMRHFGWHILATLEPNFVPQEDYYHCCWFVCCLVTYFSSICKSPLPISLWQTAVAISVHPCFLVFVFELHFLGSPCVCIA